MQVSIPTLVALFVSSILAPYLEQHDFALTAAQQAKLGDWITAAIMLVAVAATHLVHGKVKAVRAAARLRAPQPAATVQASTDAAAPVRPIKTGPIGPGPLRALIFLPLGALVLSLVGCALLANPTFDSALAAAIDVIVGAVLNKNPVIAPLVASEAGQLQQLVNGNAGATVASMQTQADNVIAASPLPVNDKAAMEAIVAGASGLLAQEATQIPANATSGLVLVFSDIQNAANLYSAQPAAPQFHRSAIRLTSDVVSAINRAAQLFGTR